MKNLKALDHHPKIHNPAFDDPALKMLDTLTPTERFRFRLKQALILLFIAWPLQAREVPLPRDQAFGFAYSAEEHQLHVVFKMPEGYHLYRERIRIEPGSEQVRLGPYLIPEGVWVDDSMHGRTRVLKRQVDLWIPVETLDSDQAHNIVKLSYQGCQDQGSCYPPHKEILSLKDIKPLAIATSIPQADQDSKPSQCSPLKEDTALPQFESDQCEAFHTLRTASSLTTIISFLGMGVLLAFTPCIFPMIPILSGIIAGQGHKIDRGAAFRLSLAYVVASATAYTGFGVIAGLFGKNLQATLQHPGVITAFSGVFLLLALSMFGIFNLELPGTLQSYLTALSRRQKAGTMAGAAIMGFLSALIVGPCIAAPLAGALIYIGETGDAVLGGLALFALGIGMGIPLLAIGTSAGSLLPRAGAWMDQIKAVFGFGLLGVGIQLLEKILPAASMLYLWGGFLILGAITLGAAEPLEKNSTMGQKLSKGLGFILMVYGILLLLGGALGSGDLSRPLSPLSLRSESSDPFKESALKFQAVSDLSDLQHRLKIAQAQKQAVMLDFYADWCTSCKEMESITFRDPRVVEALSKVLLLKVDLTKVEDEQTAILKEYSLIAPPATLFFREDGREALPLRVLGFMDPDAFLHQIQAAFP